MKKNDIIIGLVYLAKVSGKDQPLEVKDIQRVEGGVRTLTRYICLNKNTGRTIRIKSAARFKSRVSTLNA